MFEPVGLASRRTTTRSRKPRSAGCRNIRAPPNTISWPSCPVLRPGRHRPGRYPARFGRLRHGRDHNRRSRSGRTGRARSETRIIRVIRVIPQPYTVFGGDAGNASEVEPGLVHDRAADRMDAGAGTIWAAGAVGQTVILLIEVGHRPAALGALNRRAEAENPVSPSSGSSAAETGGPPDPAGRQPPSRARPCRTAPDHGRLPRHVRVSATRTGGVGAMGRRRPVGRMGGVRRDPPAGPSTGPPGSSCRAAATCSRPRRARDGRRRDYRRPSRRCSPRRECGRTRPPTE